MNKVKMELWSYRGHGEGGEEILVDSENIQEAMLIHEDDYIIGNVNCDPVTLEEKLSEYISKKQEEDEDFEFDSEDFEFILEFLNEIGFANAESVASYDSDTELELLYKTDYNENQIRYCRYDGTFHSLDENDFCKVYHFFNGSNWNTILSGTGYWDYEDYSSTELLLSENYISLDEFDGRNFKTGGDFEHQEVLRVYEVDGETAEETYLIKYWSNYNTNYITGKIVTLDELKSHLQNIDRDVDDYVKLIKELK